MKKSKEVTELRQEEIIINNVTPIPEGCSDCHVASDQYEQAAKLRQLTEHIFDIATGSKKPREINEIIESNEELTHSLQKAIDAFFPGADALNKESRENLRHLADISYKTAIAFIEDINRTIQNYEQLVGGCAGQGLKRVMLDRAKNKDPVEVTLCTGEIEEVKTSKSAKGVPISASARKLQLNTNTTT